MPKSKRDTVQINRRISKEAKQLLEDLEKDGLTLEFIIKDYVRLRRIEKLIWKRVDKKLDVLIHAIKGERVIVIEKNKEEEKKGIFSKVLSIFKKKKSSF